MLEGQVPKAKSQTADPARKVPDVARLAKLDMANMSIALNQLATTHSQDAHQRFTATPTDFAWHFASRLKAPLPILEFTWVPGEFPCAVAPAISFVFLFWGGGIPMRITRPTRHVLVF